MMERWDLRVAAGGALATVLCVCPLAHAHGETDRELPDRPRTESIATTDTGDGENHFSAGIDLVLGFGKTLAADQLPPGSASVNPINQVDSDPVHTDSFIFAFGYEPTKNLRFGVRLPFSVGTIGPDGYQSRTLSTIGNIEVEAAYKARLSAPLALVLSLGVALPTAQGTLVPATTAGLGPNFDQSSYDRYSLNYAAAASRGFEEDALFFSDRFGIVPKLVLEYHPDKRFNLEPYVKLENMISTSSDNSKSYIGELVLGARASYLVNEYFEPGVRLWTTILLGGPGDQTVGVVEPEVRFHVGDLTPYLGVIVPFAGVLASNPSQFVGVRVGASFAF